MKKVERNSKKYKLNEREYELIRDDDCFNFEEVESRITDYFNDYDYIFGDYAYGKVRLKGFYDANNKKVNKINNIKSLDEYIKNYCCYGSKTFLLKKIK